MRILRVAMVTALSASALFGVAAKAQFAPGTGQPIPSTGPFCTPQAVIFPQIVIGREGTLRCGIGATADGDDAIAIGRDARTVENETTAVGAQSSAVGAGATSIGARSSSSAPNATALGYRASAAFAGSTALGASAVTTAANQVALGASGTSVRVGDIAASTAAQSGTISVATVDANGTLGRNPALLTSVAALQTASNGALARLDTLDGQVGTLFDLRGRDRDDFKKGIAAATAMGQAAFPSAPGRTSYVLNGATFRGEAAVGGSLMHRFNSDAPIALGVGFSFAGKKNNAFRAGVAGEF